MALVVNDTFTETSDTNVTSHTGETGASWSTHPANVSGTPVVDGGSDELHTANTTNNQYIYASGTPADANLKATITFRNRSTAGQHAICAVFLRMANVALTGYSLFYFSEATPFFRLYKWNAGTPTQIGSDYTYTLPASEENWDFYVVGSSIQVVDSGGTVRLSATDSSITAAGYLGIRFSDYAATGATGGVNISRIQMWDGASLPATPVSASDTFTVSETASRDYPVAATETIGVSDSASARVLIPRTYALNDSFTPESTGVALQSHTPEDGGTWTRVGGTSGTYPIRINASGRAYTDYAAPTFISNTYEHSAVIADGTLEFEIVPASSGGGAFFGVRKADDGSGGYNTVYLYVDNGELGNPGRLRLIKRLNGVETTVGSTYDISGWPTASEKLRIVYQGTAFTVQRLISSTWTDIITGTVTGLAAQGITGLWLDSPTTGTAASSGLQVNYITSTSTLAGTDTVTVSDSGVKSNGALSDKPASDTISVADTSSPVLAKVMPWMIPGTPAVPGAAIPSAYVSKQTVWPADAQNPPPNFIELESGRMIFACSPGTSHLSTDARLAIKTAANEAAANAGTFSAETVIEPYVPATGSVDPPQGDFTGTGMYFGGGAYFTQIKEGPNRGRVWMMYTSGVDFPSGTRPWNNWRVWLRYTDNPDAPTITWSSRIEIPNLWDGGYSIQDHIKGMGPLSAMVEVPGTDGQEFVMATLGFDSTEKYEYSKLIGTKNGPDGTWSVRSVIQTPGGATATYSPSEPTAGIIHRSDGTPKLAVTVNLWPNDTYWKTSNDWGYTWEQGTGIGTIIATNATGPPEFIEAWDGSIICFYRKLDDPAEAMWAARSINGGVTWPQKWAFDSTGRMRYGNWQNLKSGRLGVCYGIETTVGSSTEASIFYQSLTLAAYTPAVAGRTPEGFTVSDSAAVTVGVGAIAKTASDGFNVSDTSGGLAVTRFIHPTGASDIAIEACEVTDSAAPVVVPVLVSASDTATVAESRIVAVVTPPRIVLEVSEIWDDGTYVGAYPELAFPYECATPSGNPVEVVTVSQQRAAFLELDSDETYWAFSGGRRLRFTTDPE